LHGLSLKGQWPSLHVEIDKTVVQILQSGLCKLVLQILPLGAKLVLQNLHDGCARLVLQLVQR